MHSGDGNAAVSVEGRGPIWASHPWHQVAGVPSAQTALATFLRQCPLLGADGFIKGQ